MLGHQVSYFQLIATLSFCPSNNFQIEEEIEKEREKDAEREVEEETRATVAMLEAEVNRSFEEKVQGSYSPEKVPDSEGDSSPASEHEYSPMSKHEDAPDGEIQTLFEGTFDDVVCHQEVILGMLGSRKHFACFCSLFFSFLH